MITSSIVTLLKEFSGSELNKGKTYKNDIQDVTYISKPHNDTKFFMHYTFTASVYGNDIYTSKLQWMGSVSTDKITLVESSCDCPAHGERSPHCKHTAALAVYLQHIYLSESNNKTFLERFTTKVDNETFTAQGNDAPSPITYQDTKNNELLNNMFILPSEALSIEPAPLIKVMINFDNRYLAPLSTSFLKCKPLKSGKYSAGTAIQDISAYIQDTPALLLAQLFVDKYDGYYRSNRNKTFADQPELYQTMLQQCIAAGVMCIDVKKNPITIIQVQAKITFVHREDNQTEVSMTFVYTDPSIMELLNTDIRIYMPTVWNQFCIGYREKEGILALISAPLPAKTIKELIKNNLLIPTPALEARIKNPNTQLDRMLSLATNTKDIPGVPDAIQPVPQATLRVALDRQRECIILTPVIQYTHQSTTIAIDEASPQHFIKLLDGTILQRDIYTEETALKELSTQCAINTRQATEIPFGHEATEILEHLDQLAQQGVSISYLQPAKKFSQKTLSVSIQVQAERDWFNLKTQTSLDGQDIGEADIIWEALMSKQKYITLQSGEILALTDKMMQQAELLGHLSLDNISTKKKNTKNIQETIATASALKKIHRSQLGLIAGQMGVEIKGDKQTKALISQLKSFDGITPVPLPKGLQATLRPYQLEGYFWLQFLTTYHFGGILADDMGLGKTIQTITHILKIYEEGNLKHPVLIVCPKSLVYNRYHELEKFAPSLIAEMIHSSKEQDKFNNPDTHIYIVPYDTMTNIVIGGLEKQFDYLVMDEAQNIKNALSKRAEAMTMIQATHKLCLTGTPVENNLLDLWSLFAVTMPGLLGKKAVFQDIYINKGNKETSIILSQKIKPFVLRRTKEAVLLDLPPKVEETIFLEMEEKQRAAYDRLLQTYQHGLMNELESEGLNSMRFKVLDALLKLRQLCLHPLLVNLSGNDINESIKLKYLKESLHEMLAQGHNVLIFSQFTGFLGYVKKLLDAENIIYSYLDGQSTTSQRNDNVNAFNTGKNRVFLISLKAGGTGLNLVAADYVIHLDPWRNPAVERQATDRAHRIGQTKTVFVQKLIIKDSIEEKVLALQLEKQTLIDDIFDGKFSGSLSKEDIKTIFS